MAKNPEASELGLKTSHVFLDTDVYRRYGHNLNDKVLQTLLRLTNDHVCTLHITDITAAEIKRQIADLAAEVAISVNKANKQLRNWRKARSRITPPPVSDDLSAPELAKEAVGQFDFLMAFGWKPTSHAAMKIPAAQIFESYFRRESPFDKTDSKEFPDAFIVAALDQWCTNNNARMYVISRDKAMMRAVEKTKTLLPLPTLENFLALLVENPEIRAKVAGIFKSHWQAIVESVRDQILNLGTVYTGSLEDGEIIEHELDPGGEMALVSYDVISASDDQIEVVAKVEASVNYEVQYLDTDTAWWDSEDKEYVGGDKALQTVKMDTTLSLLIIIDPKEEEIAEVDILTRDINVEEQSEDYR